MDLILLSQLAILLINVAWSVRSAFVLRRELDPEFRSRVEELMDVVGRIQEDRLSEKMKRVRAGGTVKQAESVPQSLQELKAALRRKAWRLNHPESGGQQ